MLEKTRGIWKGIVSFVSPLGQLEKSEESPFGSLGLRFLVIRAQSGIGLSFKVTINDPNPNPDQ